MGLPKNIFIYVMLQVANALEPNEFGTINFLKSTATSVYSINEIESAYLAEDTELQKMSNCNSDSQWLMHAK